MISYTKFSSSGGLFACANSGFGFVSHFDTLFKDYPTLYLVKGGSGTGKSSLMKKVWREAEKRALPVLPILCSSDPSSLDGLLLPTLGVAFADATAPHLLEPLLPGAREQLVDTGRFWSATMLRTRREELEVLSKSKKELYRRAYLLLEGGKNAALCRREQAKELLFKEKAGRALSGFVKKCGAKKGKTRVLFQKALSMKGALLSDALFEKAEQIYTLSPTLLGGEQILMEDLFLKMKEEGYALTLLCDPLTLKPDALYFEESGVLFRHGAPTGLDKEKILDSRRLFDRPSGVEKARSKRYRACEDLLTAEALSLLSEISVLHLQAEEIYGSAMDFSSLEEYENDLLSSLF